MSGSEEFLARWSRRKREAIAGESQAPAKDPAPPSQQADETRHARSPSAANLNSQSEPAFDLSKLPSLDTIGPNTDIRVFMQPGVPAALSRAALRRAWSADPAVRDFIGLSENSWDFTAPDSITGFGPLAPTDDVQRLLAQVFGEDAPQSTAPAGEHQQQAENIRTEADEDGPPSPQQTAGRDDSPADPVGSADEELLRREKIYDAMQQDSAEPASSTARPRRKHGGALPA